MAPILPRRVPHVAALAVAAVVAVAATSATLWVRAQHAGPALPSIDPSPVHRVVVTANRLPPLEQPQATVHRVEITASRLPAAEPVHRVVVTAPRLPQPQTVAGGAGESAGRPL
jgi:hypothetical protein